MYVPAIEDELCSILNLNSEALGLILSNIDKTLYSIDWNGV